MAAYRCPECEVSFPKHKDFDVCPTCGTNTKYTSIQDPDVDGEEAFLLVSKKRRQEQFEQWCRDNWTENDLTISAIRFHFKHTKQDAMRASGVIKMFDQAGIHMRELHVFLPGA
jgi:uncharacterized Zn finger protein (UPF0148 family)